jgi:hypothetical protein
MSTALVAKARRSLRATRVRSRAIPLELQMRAAGIPTPETEVQFDPEHKWAFDYAWRAWRIACEVEGGVFSQGRHTRGLGYTRDCEKYNQAAILKWLVIRVTTAMVEDGRAIDVLRAAFAARGLE